MQHSFTSWHTATAVALIMIAAGTYLVYTPGLSGDFAFDDLHNIRNNELLAITKLDAESLQQAALSRSGDISSRPISMLSFGVNHYFSEFSPYAYKVTNLVIHLLNGLGLFFLTRLILIAYRRRFNRQVEARHIMVASTVIGAAWLLHPLNLTSVLYVVQRMNSLAALFIICGLICYLWGRLRMDSGRRGTVLAASGLVVFMPLAVLSKENGALLPLFALILELILFGYNSQSRLSRYLIKGLFIITLALPLAGFTAFLLYNPEWLSNGYINRDFTLWERLLTECRVLWLYLFLIFIPDVRFMGLYHDDLAVSHSLIAPLTTLPAVLGIVALAIAAGLLYKRIPLFTLGVLFFLAGHSMESTLLPLELVYEHRNYLPLYGLLLPAFYYLTHPISRRHMLKWRYAAVVLAVTALATATAVRAAQWGDPLTLSRAEVAHHPESPRANYALGRLYFSAIENGTGKQAVMFKKARQYFANASLADADYTEGLFGLITLYEYTDRSRPAGIVDILAKRLRNAPFANNNGNMLAQLVTCQEQQKCRLTRAEMGKLLQAALRNPTLAGSNKASVLTSTSRYFAMQGQYQVALKLARQAVQAVPDSIVHRLNVVHWLITMGKAEQARQALSEIKSMDTLHRHAKYIREQEQMLHDLEFIQRFSGK